MTPPPIPDTRPVRFISFEGYSRAVRVSGPTLQMEQLQSAQQAAADWMNANPHIDLITLKSHLTRGTAIVTVWYRA